VDTITATLIGTSVAAFGIVAGFTGVLVGQRMARATQRAQWLRDKRTEDCQMLVTSLATSYLGLITHWREGLPQSTAHELISIKNGTNALI
jgi:hypothetical protein